MKSLLAATAVLLAAVAADASAAGTMRITEYMYKGFGGEFIEFTNVGDTAVDMTGWSYDDNSQLPGTVSLSAYGVVAPGESVILTEDVAATFATNWNLSNAVKIIGDLTVNIGGSDQINLYDAGNALIDSITWGSTIPGSIATDGSSGWTTVEHLGQDSIADWTLSTVGDAQQSVANLVGDVGNPGSFFAVSENVDAYGSGCAGTGGFTPSLALYGVPASLETVTLSIQHGLGGSTAFLLFGTGQAAIPMGNGCTLNVAPLAPVFLAVPLGGVGPGQGAVEAPVVLHSVPSGVTITMQAFVADAGTSVGFANSNGLEITFP